MNDYDLLTIKINPALGFFGVEWRGLFIFHGHQKSCEEFCLKFTEKLDQVKMERSNFDQLQAGDYLIRKREGRSYAAWRILNGRIALDGTPVEIALAGAAPLPSQSIHDKIDRLEEASRLEEAVEEVFGDE